MKNSKANYYHKLINNEVVYEKKSINRYNKNNGKTNSMDKLKQLEVLKDKINKIQNCELKKTLQILFFQMVIRMQKL